MKAPILLVCAGLLISQSYVQSDTLSPDILSPDIGSIITPRGELYAWESYPNGLLRSRGEQVRALQPGESYTVTGKKTLRVLIFGDEIYLQVVPTGEDVQPAWVFQGREGASLPPNLVPLDEEEDEEE